MELHNAMRDNFIQWNWSVNAKNLEEYKRLFLMKRMGVETSKALTIADLKVAIALVKSYDIAQFVLDLIKKGVSFEYKKYELLSKPQLFKIYRLMYKLNLSKKGLKTFIKKAINRPCSALTLTKSEAHYIIQRLEKWESRNEQR